MTNLDPQSIIVLDRQRHSVDLDENFITSVNRRLIHPIIVRRQIDPDSGEEQTRLVAGGMRLAALIAGGTTELIEGTHFRYMDDLDEVSAQVIELEENLKRTDLSWRDHVTAVGKLHDLYKSRNENWKTEKTAAELRLHLTQVNRLLVVYRNIDSPLLKDSQGWKQSYSILQTAADRKAASIVSDINNLGTQIFSQEISPLQEEESSENQNNGPSNGTSNSDCPIDLISGNPSGNTIEHPPAQETVQETLILDTPKPRPRPASFPPIICADFLSWIESYNGPKFTLIHCDFPYDVDYKKHTKNITSTSEDYDSSGYFRLLDSLCNNLDKIASYSAHLVFWFSMEHYQETKNKLLATGLFVHSHPLVWFKSDNSGIIPGTGNQFPRRVYETAFLASRRKRSLIKPLANAYSAPSPGNPLHPSQKHEPVLKHFFSMLVDETTDVLDPTCGSGAAIRVAEDLGARSALGLEINPQYAEAALATTITARNMRKAAKQ